MLLREGTAIAPPLRPYLLRLWASDAGAPGAARRERTLPTATMSLVFRLSEAPLRLFDSVEAGSARDLGHCIVGGVRDRFYVRDISLPSRSVGAQLRPLGCAALLGVPAAALAQAHTRLGDLWGAAAEDMRERLAAARTPRLALDLFEALLTARLTESRAAHPAVAFAVARLGAEAQPIGSVVRASGCSHRHFIALFRESVGLAPKAYCRVQRFQAALRQLAAQPESALAELAADAGFSDQAHMNREFAALAGLSPGAYRRSAPANLNHVPLAEVNFVQADCAARR